MREKNFELANKLEPERKMQPGRVLGLQPWQVAIWFLEPQLEKDHDVLKCQFDAVQDENDTILSYNRKLQAEYVEEARRPYVSRFVLEQLRLNHSKPTGAGGV